MQRYDTFQSVLVNVNKFKCLKKKKTPCQTACSSPRLRFGLLHLVKQKIHLLLHPQHIRRLAFFDLLVRYPPPPVVHLASSFQSRSRFDRYPWCTPAALRRRRARPRPAPSIPVSRRAIRVGGSVAAFRRFGPAGMERKAGMRGGGS